MAKVTVLGCGHVGSTLSYALIATNVVDELVILNRTMSRAEGEAADLSHAAALVERNVRIEAGGSPRAPVPT